MSQIRTTGRFARLTSPRFIKGRVGYDVDFYEEGEHQFVLRYLSDSTAKDVKAKYEAGWSKQGLQDYVLGLRDAGRFKK